MATPPTGFQPAPLPPDEAERLRALHRTALLDSGPDPRLDRLADMAARLLGRPIGLVSLIDRDRQFLVARCGIDASQTGRDEAFCAHAILKDDIFEVLDTHADPRFAGNPLVLGPPFIRNYVGKPLIDADGYRLGTLCVIDRVPRAALDSAERAILLDLAALVTDLIEYRAAALTAESERQRADRVLALKDDYLASMAHELRTPLNAVTGFSQLLKMTGAEAALTKAQADYLNTIVESAEYLAMLVNETLDSHADQADPSGGGRLRSDPVEIDPIMTATGTLIRPLAERLGVTVTVDPAGALAVWADPLRLRQVLINLVSNAVKYNRPGGTVHLRAEADEDGQTVRVICADTGLGIAQKDLPNLFNAYFRVAETADEIEGSGLGLRITRRLVAMMGGTLTVASREGAGSTFTVTLSRQA